MRAFPYLIDRTLKKKGKKLEPVDPKKHNFDEKWLQDLIIEHPELIPTGEIETIFEPLVFIGREVPVPTGINRKNKLHKFDLGDVEKKILVECKSHTWTESGNIPSVKITTWDQAMYYFHASPRGYQKIFVVLKDYNAKKEETLCDYYLRTKDHLIPKDVEIWELDDLTGKAHKKN